MLDRYPEVFSEVPGLCTAVQHGVPISAELKSKRLKAYKVPQAYQAEVSRQIQELLNLDFIEAISTSSQASPLVVLNQKIKKAIELIV